MKTLQTKIGKNRKSNDKEIEKSKIENEIKHLYKEKRIPKKKRSFNHEILSPSQYNGIKKIKKPTNSQIHLPINGPPLK